MVAGVGGVNAGVNRDDAIYSSQKVAYSGSMAAYFGEAYVVKLLTNFVGVEDSHCPCENLILFSIQQLRSQAIVLL